VVPALIGPAAAGVISRHAGWRMVFLGLIPIVLGVGALAIRPIAALGAPVVGEGQERPSWDVIGLAVVAVVGAGVMLGGLQSRSVPLLVVLVVLGGAALGWAFRRITPAGTLRVARGLPAAVAVRGMLTFAFLGADAFVALALTNVRGTSTQFAGVVLSSAALTWTAGSWTAARTIGRVGPRALVSGGLVLVGVGLVAMAWVVGTDVSPWFAVGAWLVGGLGIGLAYSPLSQAVLAAADPAEMGAAASALQLSDVLGFALGSGIGGALGNVVIRSTIAPGAVSSPAPTSTNCRPAVAAGSARCALLRRVSSPRRHRQ
jgi:MFS family permease